MPQVIEYLRQYSLDYLDQYFPDYKGSNFDFAIGSISTKEKSVKKGKAELVFINTEGLQSKPMDICIVDDINENCDEIAICEGKKGLVGTFQSYNNGSCFGTSTLFFDATYMEMDIIVADITLLPDQLSICDGFPAGGVNEIALGTFKDEKLQLEPIFIKNGEKDDYEVSKTFYGDLVTFTLFTKKLCNPYHINGIFKGTNDSGMIEFNIPE